VGSEARASPEPGGAAVGTSAAPALLPMPAVGRRRTALSGCVSAPEGATGHAGRRPPSHRLRRLCVWAARWRALPRAPLSPGGGAADPRAGREATSPSTHR
jgi:hypothetical protein